MLQNPCFGLVLAQSSSYLPHFQEILTSGMHNNSLKVVLHHLTELALTM
jgi:hypothetical protein